MKNTAPLSYSLFLKNIMEATTILSKDKRIYDGDIEVCLKFENSEGRIRFNENTPDIVEKGLRKWFRREMRL